MSNMITLNKPRQDPITAAITRDLRLQMLSACDLVNENISNQKYSKADVFQFLRRVVSGEKGSDLHAEAIRVLGSLRDGSALDKEIDSITSSVLLQKPSETSFDEAIRSLAKNEHGRTKLTEQIKPYLAAAYDSLSSWQSLTNKVTQYCPSDPKLLVALILQYPGLLHLDDEGLVGQLQKLGDAGFSAVMNELASGDDELIKTAAQIVLAEPTKYISVLTAALSSSDPAERNAVIKTLGFINTDAAAPTALLSFLKIKTEELASIVKSPSKAAPAIPSTAKKPFWGMFSRAKLNKNEPANIQKPNIVVDELLSSIGALTENLGLLAGPTRQLNILDEGSPRSPEVLPYIEREILLPSIDLLNVLETFPDSDKISRIQRNIDGLWVDILTYGEDNIFPGALARFFAKSSEKQQVAISEAFNGACYKLANIKEISDEHTEAVFQKLNFSRIQEMSTSAARKREEVLKELLPSIVLLPTTSDRVIASQMGLGVHIRGHDQDLVTRALTVFDSGKAEWPTRMSLRVLQQRCPTSEVLRSRLEAILVPDSGYPYSTVSEAIDILCRVARDADPKKFFDILSRLSYDQDSHIQTMALDTMRHLDPTLSFVA